MTRWDLITVRAAWVLLIVFTALSSYLNARRAGFDIGATNEQLAFHAGIPPVMLVAALFAELAALSSMHRTAKGVVVAGLVLVFGTTLAASYVAVLAVTNAWNPHAPGWLNAALAAVPDIIIVMSGVTVLSLRMRRHGLASANSRTPQLSRLRRLADAATARAEAALTVPLSAAEDDPEIADRTLTDPAAECPDAAGGLSAESSADPRPAGGGPSARRSAEPSADPALEPFIETAIRLEEAKLIRGKTAVDYARILRAVADGWSPTRIKSTYGYSHKTTADVVAAAAQPRTLTAV
jgi:hypothetical protein